MTKVMIHDKIPYSINMECSMEEENIVKRACRELGITQKALSEKIGVSPNSLNVMVSTNKISRQLKVTIELLLENNKLKEEVSLTSQLKVVLNQLMKGV